MQAFFRVAAIIYIVYLAVTLLVISTALNFLPHKYMHDTYGRQLETGWVLLNPFTISLDISDARLNDTNGELFVAFSSASINLSLGSMWQPGWVFDALTLQGLDLEVTRITENKYNFSDLLNSNEESATTSSDGSSMPRVTVHDLTLQSDVLMIKDLARKTPYSSQWSGLQIHMLDASTVRQEGKPYTVTVEGESGGKLAWNGEISIPQGNSTGHLSVTNLYLRNLWLFAEPWLQFELKDGRLAVEGKYQINWNDALSYSVSDGQIGLSSIDILPKSLTDLPNTALSLAALDITDIAVNSATKTVALGVASVGQLAVSGWMRESGISLEQMFAVELPASADSADAESDGSRWKLSVNEAKLLNSELHWRSPFTEPELLDVQQIGASIGPITWPLSGESQISVDVAMTEKAQITARGTLAMADGNAAIDYTLDALPLSWFNPNLPDALKAKVTSGTIALKGHVNLKNYTPTSITLDGSIREFSARSEDEETELTGWDLVRFQGLAADIEAHTLTLEKLAIETYTGRLHIQEDGSINASNIWKAEVGEQAQEVTDNLTQEKPWAISLPSITITDSEIDYMDRSLPIYFRTVIGDIEGEVLNLSSRPGKSASVEIKGSVDGYAPVALKGSVAPFAEQPDLNLKLTFDGVDMAGLSPYSSTYAGYKIDRGLLALQLDYTLKNNQLQGNNSVVIDKLKLGDKIASDKAVDIPLGLALAILTDANGVIDMQVPVSGDINSPDFELSGIIFKAFINLLTKAITAPFTLLAGLVDSAQDLQFIAFGSGSVALTDTAKEKLAQLSKALDQRPNLSLVITGRLNIQADQERMQKNALDAQLLKSGVSPEQIKAKGPDWENVINKKYVASFTGSSDVNTLSIHEQYRLLIETFVVSDEKLIDLAEQRAVTVKTYLVNESGMAASRAVIAKVSMDAKANDFSGVELGIEN